MFKEMTAQEASNRRIDTSFNASSRFEVVTQRTAQGWAFAIAEKELANEFTKMSVEAPYEPYHGESRIFAWVDQGNEVGYITVGYQAWNKSAWLYFIGLTSEYRRHGIGTKLMEKAEEIARSFGARILLLETQSNNPTAIHFYLACGYDLVGLNTKAYTNNDIENHEVYLCMGKELAAD